MKNRIYASLLLLGALTAIGCARKLPPDLAANPVVSAALAKAIGGATAAPTETAAVADPTGWATLKGHFALTGPVPLKPNTVTKDPEVCGNIAPDLSAMVAADNSLQGVLVYLSTKLPSQSEPWIHGSYAETEKATVDFDQKKCIFLTHVMAMRSTQKLKVLNSDPVAHNTNINGFSYNTLIPSSSFNDQATVKALNEPSPVSCSIHPWMAAYVMATPHPYYAVTDAAGNFEIKHVPAGVDLEFRVWQERVKYVGGGSLNGASVTWPKGRVKMKLANDESRELEVVLDAAKFQ